MIIFPAFQATLEVPVERQIKSIADIGFSNAFMGSRNREACGLSLFEQSRRDEQFGVAFHPSPVIQSD